MHGWIWMTMGEYGKVDIDGWMDGWMDGQMDGWVHGCMGVQMDGYG